MTIRMDEGAAELLYTLHRAGYAAYVVGGCVRDSLLGLTPHDWDLCTSALPQQVMELFGAQRCIPTGLQHGTVTVKQSGALYEITTFRTEGTYTDGRHPDEVHFVPDVREDLARRDLTINAMAYNEKEGLVDPFGGQADLQSGIVRAVGVPRQRFTEDALRILRLYRFAARFGFAIDPPTAQAAQELCAHLDCVSVERIEEELAKLLAAPAPAAYLDKKILLVILPELSSEALAAVVAVAGHSIARPIAFGNRVPPQRTVLRETTVTPDFTIYARRLLGKYNLCTVQRLAALGTALQPEHAADFAALSELAEQLDADGVCCRVSQLAVNGRDLMAAGVPAGPGIRKVLEALLDGVIREEYPNERQALLAAVQQLAAS